MKTSSSTESLRIVLLAGGLGQGGAEKQLLYIVRALQDLGVDIRLLTLTRGEHYETELIQRGVRPIWVGRVGNPIVRLAIITALAKRYKPHILHSAHFFANLYVSLLPKITRKTLGVGSIRNDAFHEVETNGHWSRWLLRSPTALIANSFAGQRNAGQFGISKERIHVLPNVIDLEEFDSLADTQPRTCSRHEPCIAVTVARLVPVKRLERFLEALAIARQNVPNLVGWVIGDGSERSRLEFKAHELGLFPDNVRFWGRRSDVPRLLGQAHMFVLTSDREGFPNVILEAMAAALPVITSPAGDSGVVVQDNSTGYVVPFEDIGAIAGRVRLLATSPDLCVQMGRAGRQCVEQQYSYASLKRSLMSVYFNIAKTTRESTGKSLYNILRKNYGDLLLEYGQ